MRAASPPRRGASRRRRGSISAEMAAVMPVLLLLSLGASDLVGLMRTQLRVDATAQQLGQLVSQCNRIVSPGDIAQFWGYAQRILGTSSSIAGTDADGAAIISAVGLAGGVPQVAWQFRSGRPAHASAIGAPGGPATLPGGAGVPPGQTLFVTEIVLSHEDWSLAASLMGGSTMRTLRGTSLFLTRAPDAPSLLLPPPASAQPSCTA